MKNALKTFNSKVDWGFFLVLLFSVFTPFIYKTFRTYLVSSEGMNTLDVASSWGYLYLIFETINLFITVPTYGFIKRNTKNEIDVKQKTLIAFGTALIASLFAFMLIAIISLSLTNRMYNLPIDNDGTTIGDNYSRSIIYSYLLTLGFSLSLSLMINVITAYLLMNKKKTLGMLYVTFHMSIIMIIDTIFIKIIPHDININAGSNLMSIAYSSLTSTILFFVISIFIIYLFEKKSWNNSINTFSLSKWRNDYKEFWKNGFWLGFEGLWWNILWTLGVTFWAQTADQSTAFWQMDGLFWSALLIPSAAINSLIAERISSEETYKDRKDAVYIGFAMSLLVLLCWAILAPLIIEVLFPAIYNGAEQVQMLKLLQQISWIALIGFVFHIPSRVLYSYFAVTWQGVKLFIGTFFMTLLIWFPGFISFVICSLNGTLPLTNAEFLFVPALYGIGLFGIFIFYLISWILEDETKIKTKLINKKFKNINEEIAELLKTEK